MVKKATKKKVAKKAQSSKKETKTKKTKTKKTEKNNNNYLGITVLVVIVIAAILLIVSNMDFGSGDTAAKVGNEKITNEMLDAEYENLPDGYKGFITKADYLEQVLIPQTVLTIASTDISSDKIETVYQDYLVANSLSEDNITTLLANQGIDIEKFKTLIRIQIHLNETVYEGIEVTEEEIVEFYEAQKESFPGEDIPTLEETREELEFFLKGQKSQAAQLEYVEMLKDEYGVEIMYEADETTSAPEAPSTLAEGTFNPTGNELCTEGGKPVIRMFSTSTCPHCNWIKATFDSTVKEYVDSGDIVAYHWILDTKDNSLTQEVETTVPAEEIAVYQRYNPQGSVPTFVFGCQYVRIGTGYERENDLASEETEFRQLIEGMI